MGKGPSEGLRWWLIGLVGLAILVFLAYQPCLHGAFLWDDDQHAASPLLSHAGALWRIWVPGYTAQYYPITYESFWLERHLWGPAPTGYHVVNMALHALNALLAAWCLRRLGFRGAWLAAAVFALHPVNSESVAWISERKNLLSAFFYLSAFAAFLDFEDHGSRASYAASIGLFLLALLSKTTAVSLPAALLVVRWGRGRDIDERFLKVLAPFFALAVVAATTTAGLERFRVGAVGPEFNLSLLQKLLLSTRALFFYLGNLLWPLRLAFSYEHWTLDPWILRQWLSVAAAAAGVAAAVACGKRYGRAFPAGLGFFVVTLSPALGFFSVYTFRFSYVADHYQYLASLGPIALAAEALWRDRRLRWVGIVAAAALLPLTRARAVLYREPEGVWRDAVLNAPGSALAHNNYGAFLMARGDIAGSEEHFREAIRLKGDYADAYYNLGVALLRSGDEPRAVGSFQRALAIQPGHSRSRKYLELLGRPGP
jgi:tetratricopeptide (TPR) repeat protein